jgi:hypothetical protein
MLQRTHWFNHDVRDDDFIEILMMLRSSFLRYGLEAIHWILFIPDNFLYSSVELFYIDRRWKLDLRFVLLRWPPVEQSYCFPRFHLGVSQITTYVSQSITTFFVHSDWFGLLWAAGSTKSLSLRWTLSDTSRPLKQMWDHCSRKSERGSRSDKADGASMAIKPSSSRTKSWAVQQPTTWRARWISCQSAWLRALNLPWKRSTRWTTKSLSSACYLNSGGTSDYKTWSAYQAFEAEVVAVRIGSLQVLPRIIFGR